MKSITLRAVLVVLLGTATIATAGCFEREEVEYYGDAVLHVCDLDILQAQPDPRTLLNLSFADFEDLAPLFAALLVNHTNESVPRLRLVGTCEFGSGLEGGRLLNAYRASDAEPQVLAGLHRRAIFNVTMPDGANAWLGLPIRHFEDLGWDDKAAEASTSPE